jgi:DNA-binding NarL/FixJ family response regulator
MNALQDHILVVDDDFLIAEGLCAQIEEMGIKVCGTAATAEQAVALAQRYQPFIVLMDMRLRGRGDGVDAALAIYSTVGSKVIFITGSREPATMNRIQLDHPAAVLFKPVSFRELHTAIDTARRM